MKVFRSGAVLMMIAALGITGTVIIKQHMRICGLRESLRSLAAQYQGLSATNASLLSVQAAQNDELIRLRQQTSEVLRLRNQLTQARQQLTAAGAANESPKAESPNEFSDYLAKEKLRFVGFDTPENAFQSLNWAAASGDYTNWLAALAPARLEEELADPKSLERFHWPTARTTGMQILAAKLVSSDRVELKVRVDSESAVCLLIYPMVAIGNEWRLGDEIQSYTQVWDSTSTAQ
jgi:hypothetical protein